MQFSRISVFIFAAVVAILTIAVEAKQVVKFGKVAKGKSTWFDGHDLKGAACYGDLENNSHVNAKDAWHIGAVHMASYTKGEAAACFECAKITYNRRSVIVRIIDDCADCAANQIDLTSSAFKVLASLDKGVIAMEYEFIRCPTKGLWLSSPPPKKN